MRLFITSLFVGLILPLSLCAQAPVEFESTTIEKPLQSATRITITKEEIKASGAQEISELLEKNAGISTVSGAFISNQLYLRGGDASQILVLLDGAPFYDASSSLRTIDINVVPLSLVEKVEVIKGSQVVSFGGQALSGVISITTIDDTPSYRNKITLRGGSLDRDRKQANLDLQQLDQKEFEAGLNRSLSETTSVQFFSTWKDNDYSSPVKNSTQVYPNLRRSVDLNALTRSEKYNLVSRARYYQQNRNILARSSDTPDYEQTVEVSALSFVLKSKESVQLPSAYVSIVDSLRSYQAHQPLNFGFGPISPFDETYQGTLLMAGAQQTLTKSETFDLNLSLSHANELGHFTFNRSSMFFPPATTIPAVIADFEKRQEINGLSLLSTYKASESLILSSGLRTEQYAGTDSGLSYQAGLAWKDMFRLELAQGFKAPTLFQRFSPEYGNTNLEPETAQTLSLEYSHNTENYSVSFAPFFTKTTDLIVATGPSGSLRYQNLDEAQVLGAETLVRYSKDGYRSGLNFTYQEPKDVTDKTWLVRRPRWLAGAYMSKTFHSFDLGLDFRAVGSRKDLGSSGSSRVTLPEYSLWNISSHYRMSESLTARAQLRNIFDTRFEESFGYRSEGFVAYLGIEWMN